MIVGFILFGIGAFIISVARTPFEGDYSAFAPGVESTRRGSCVAMLVGAVFCVLGFLVCLASL